MLSLNNINYHSIAGELDPVQLLGRPVRQRLYRSHVSDMGGGEREVPKREAGAQRRGSGRGIRRDGEQDRQREVRCGECTMGSATPGVA